MATATAYPGCRFFSQLLTSFRTKVDVKWIRNLLGLVI